MEAGTHSIWISEQLQELGHEVIVANVRELRAISHSDRKSDQVDAEKLARYARHDPKILRPIAHRTVAQQETLTLIRARDLLVRLRTGTVNLVRGLAKSCGYRLPVSSTLCFAKRCVAMMPPGLSWIGVLTARGARFVLFRSQFQAPKRDLRHAILGSILEKLATRLLRSEKNSGRIASHQRKWRRVGMLQTGVEDKQPTPPRLTQRLPRQIS